MKRVIIAILLLLWCRNAFALGAVVQVTNPPCNTAVSNTLACAYGSNVTSGNIGYVTLKVLGTFSTIADTCGDTFTLDLTSTSGKFYSFPITCTGANTITIVTTGTVGLSAVAYETSGMTQTVDANSTSGATPKTTDTILACDTTTGTPSLTTTNANDLVFCMTDETVAKIYSTGPADDSSSPAATWVNDGHLGAAAPWINSTHVFTSATGSYAGKNTVTVTGTYFFNAIAYKQAAARKTCQNLWMGGCLN